MYICAVPKVFFMKKVNSLSGGQTSSYLAVNYPADYEVFSVVCLDDASCKVKDESLLRFAQEKLNKFTNQYGEFCATAEDDKTLAVMRDLEQKIGREITWIRGVSFDKLINEGKQTRLPSRLFRFCTVEMKMLPIFKWWFENIGEKVDMRIGFRFDEFKRMERFFNNNNPNKFSMPIACKNYGSKMQQHQEFEWRYCSFPLIENGITKKDVQSWWNKNSKICEADLFNTEKHIEFPAISNCVGCFHKNKATIAAQTEMNPEKIQWFANQEQIGKGTWHSDKVPYSELINNYKDYAGEVLFEMKVLGQSCDSGGCTD